MVGSADWVGDGVFSNTFCAGVRICLVVAAAALLVLLKTADMSKSVLLCACSDELLSVSNL